MTGCGADYEHTRRWGHWLRRQAKRAHGFIWESLRNRGGLAVVLFGDRCAEDFGAGYERVLLHEVTDLTVDLEHKAGTAWLRRSSRTTASQYRRSAVPERLGGSVTRPASRANLTSLAPCARRGDTTGPFGRVRSLRGRSRAVTDAADSTTMGKGTRRAARMPGQSSSAGRAGPAGEVVAGRERRGGRERDEQHRRGAGEKPLRRGRHGDAVGEQAGDTQGVRDGSEYRDGG